MSCTIICSSVLATISCANRLRHFRKSWYCSRLRSLREELEHPLRHSPSVHQFTHIKIPTTPRNVTAGTLCSQDRKESNGTYRNSESALSMPPSCRVFTLIQYSPRLDLLEEAEFLCQVGAHGASPVIIIICNTPPVSATVLRLQQLQHQSPRADACLTATL